jgi:hypothetical protein
MFMCFECVFINGINGIFSFYKFSVQLKFVTRKCKVLVFY